MRGNNDHLTQREGGKEINPEGAKMQHPWPTPHEKSPKSTTEGAIHAGKDGMKK